MCVCVTYEYVSVLTHTYVLTQSMLVEGAGVKRERTGGIQMGLTWGGEETKGAFVPALDPTVASEQEVGARPPTWS